MHSPETVDRGLLEDSEALQVALETRGIGLWSWDPNTDRVRWSLQIASVVGVDIPTWASFKPMVDPADLPVAEAQLVDVMAGRRDTIENTLRVRRPDGRQIWMATSGRAIRAADGRLIRIVGTVTDVTASRRADELATAAARVETIGMLAGGVAHDFNNLLTAILGYGELIQRSLPPGAPATSMMVALMDAATRGAQLTAQLLTFARKQVVRPRVIEVNQRVVRVLDLLRRLIGEDIEIVTDLAPDAGRVRIDPGQFEQILINLAVNARDAMPRGGRLTIASARQAVGAGDPTGLAPGEYAMVAVSDTGVGIEADILPRVFEPFFTTKSHGTGLGLATCHQIVISLGGRIQARSGAGGSTIEFALPRVEAPVEDARPGARAEAARGTGTVLLVEDEPAIRSLVSTYLGGLGYRVLSAGDGVEALAVAAREPDIDALISDVIMPRLGGADLALRLLRERPRLRVLFTSGYSDQQLDLASFPGAGFLAKPYALADLGERLRAVLGR